MNNDVYESTPISDELYRLVADDVMEIEQRINKSQSLNKVCISTIYDRVWDYVISKDVKESKEALDDVINFLLIQESLLNTLVKNMDEISDKLLKLSNEYKNTESIIKLIKLNWWRFSKCTWTKTTLKLLRTV